MRFALDRNVDGMSGQNGILVVAVVGIEGYGKISVAVVAGIDGYGKISVAVVAGIDGYGRILVVVAAGIDGYCGNGCCGVFDLGVDGHSSRQFRLLYILSQQLILVHWHLKFDL